MHRPNFVTRLTAIFTALALSISLLGWLPARAAGKIQIMTATTDLASLAQEVGGDKINVESIARGYQDSPAATRIPTLSMPSPAFS